MIRNSMADVEESRKEAALDAADLRPEPWMKEFIQGRHTQKEWDAFFMYCKAGLLKRFFIQVASLMARVFGLI